MSTEILSAKNGNFVSAFVTLIRFVFLILLHWLKAFYAMVSPSSIWSNSGLIPGFRGKTCNVPLSRYDIFVYLRQTLYQVMTFLPTPRFLSFLINVCWIWKIFFFFTFEKQCNSILRKRTPHSVPGTWWTLGTTFFSRAHGSQTCWCQYP